MVAVHLVTVRLLAAAEQLPRLVRRKVAMLRAFTVGKKFLPLVKIYSKAMHNLQPQIESFRIFHLYFSFSVFFSMHR